MTFADTNWLEAMFFEAAGRSETGRRVIVERFLRRHAGPLGISHVVYLEARNVFTRVSGEADPEEWRQLEEGLNGRFYLDPMNWDLVRRETIGLIRKYAHKERLGTFDLALLSAAKLAGATRLLSFDETLKGLAVAEGLEVFPPLDRAGKQLLARLRT